MVFLGQHFIVITVVEILRQAEVQHLHFVRPVEAGNLLTEAAIQYAVLQSRDQFVRPVSILWGYA